MSTLQERTDPTMRASTISGSANAYISTMDPKYARKYIHLHTILSLCNKSQLKVEGEQFCCLFTCCCYRWKNWWIRGVFAGIMIGLFIMFIYMGPLALTLLVNCLKCNCSDFLGYLFYGPNMTA